VYQSYNNSDLFQKFFPVPPWLSNMLQRTPYFDTSRLVPLRRRQRRINMQHHSRCSRRLMSLHPRVRRMVLSIVPLSWAGSRGLRRAMCQAKRIVFPLVVQCLCFPVWGRVGLAPQPTSARFQHPSPGNHGLRVSSISLHFSDTPRCAKSRSPCLVRSKCSFSRCVSGAMARSPCPRLECLYRK
jgi:hypothetical protein